MNYATVLEWYTTVQKYVNNFLFISYTFTIKSDTKNLIA
jgi:hypothetical protein